MHFSESLKKNRDFRTVYRDGKSYANRLLVMYTLKNDSDRNRLGISVSKKVGNSVVRHHITRLVRESYRLHEEMFHSGWDIVVIARAGAKNASYHEIESALLHLGNLQKIMNPEEKKMESHWKKILIFLIKWYRKYISPMKTTKCPYYPTCSTYGLEAVEKYGAWKGGLHWRSGAFYAVIRSLRVATIRFHDYRRQPDGFLIFTYTKFR